MMTLSSVVSIDATDVLDAPGSLWNDWHWQMNSALKCGSAEFLRNAGIQVKDLTAERKRSITPYMLRLLLKLKVSDPEAFQAQYLQIVAVPETKELHQWSWALKQNPAVKFKAKASKLTMPAWIKTLLWGRGCQSSFQALENFYPKTDIIIATARCAVNCSFCFREVGDAKGEAASISGNMEVLFSAVKEVIRRGTPHVLITGGDPLTRSNNQLRQILEPLACAASVEVVRIATRMIVHLPMRFYDSELLALLREVSEKMKARGSLLRIVTHINHPSELTEEVLTAIRNVQSCGVEILNQTVALKGVNDNAQTLQKLFMQLDRLAVRPYKLFHTMPVAGTESLRVPLRRFRQLVASLHQHLPGTAVPQANAPTLIGKIPVAPAGRFMLRIPFIRRILVRNWRGEWYLYEDAVE
jgi:lysine 2,3-aminomutase